MPLDDPDIRFLTAARGYVELGMFLEANDELEKIDPLARHVPEVLAIRLEIFRGLEKWQSMEVVAKKLTEYSPDVAHWWISWAFATRRCASTGEAKAILIDAQKRHPADAMILYKLACYECRVGNVELAREHLTKAFRIDKRLRILALEDEDLEEMWGTFKL